jgi:hypothetical protein
MSFKSAFTSRSGKLCTLNSCGRTDTFDSSNFPQFFQITVFLRFGNIPFAFKAINVTNELQYALVGNKIKMQLLNEFIHTLSVFYLKI